MILRLLVNRLLIRRLLIDRLLVSGLLRLRIGRRLLLLIRRWRILRILRVLRILRLRRIWRIRLRRHPGLLGRWRWWLISGLLRWRR